MKKSKNFNIIQAEGLEPNLKLNIISFLSDKDVIKILQISKKGMLSKEDLNYEWFLRFLKLLQLYVNGLVFNCDKNSNYKDIYHKFLIVTKLPDYFLNLWLQNKEKKQCSNERRNNNINYIHETVVMNKEKLMPMIINNLFKNINKNNILYKRVSALVRNARDYFESNKNNLNLQEKNLQEKNIKHLFFIIQNPILDARCEQLCLEYVEDNKEKAELLSFFCKFKQKPSLIPHSQLNKLCIKNNLNDGMPK